MSSQKEVSCATLIYRKYRKVEWSKAFRLIENAVTGICEEERLIEGICPSKDRGIISLPKKTGSAWCAGTLATPRRSRSSQDLSWVP